MNHPDFDSVKKKDITRAKLWPWYVKYNYNYGIKIYWYITEWPAQNPNDFESKIKSQIKQYDPKWKESI